MITETYYNEDSGQVELLRFRAVAIKPYPGCTDGALPLHAEDCPHKGEISCYTRSESSLCGGYMGHIGMAVIRCCEKMETANG